MDHGSLRIIGYFTTIDVYNTLAADQRAGYWVYILALPLGTTLEIMTDYMCDGSLRGANLAHQNTFQTSMSDLTKLAHIANFDAVQPRFEFNELVPPPPLWPQRNFTISEMFSLPSTLRNMMYIAAAALNLSVDNLALSGFKQGITAQQLTNEAEVALSWHETLPSNRTQKFTPSNVETQTLARDRLLSFFSIRQVKEVRPLFTRSKNTNGKIAPKHAHGIC
jgi:hypothetical protein